ncbi:MAG: TIGR03619 family F420-dependent LLM class oxidoreductase [Acidimicrobiales bacterium]|nr:TIGR03619 family F420-dependent LLM class oxidoreductase [Acidimicrobiales bacterium]
MRLGVSLAPVGRLADPVSVRSAATAAEQVGYASVWVDDALRCRRPEGFSGPAGADADSPAGEPTVALDPLSVLTYAAAVTDRVRLGTSVLVAPWYRPALLARSLTSLDVLSDGRLTVGLGLGGRLDELAAMGVPQDELGRRLDDALDMLDTVWAPVGGRQDDRGTGRAAPSLPPPVQRPRPPVLLATSTPEGLDRVARRADGWNPTGLPVETLPSLWARVRDTAAGYGRAPDALELVVHADLAVSDRPIDRDRPSYAGTIEQVAADIADTRRAGAHEVILCLQGDHCLDETLDVYARIAEAVDVTMPTRTG